MLDHKTLLEAFQLINDTTPSRLLILGEGPERASLEKITADGYGRSCAAPWFVDTPWA